MACNPPLAAVDFHSKIFSPLFKPPIYWDSYKTRLVFVPLLRKVPIWTIMVLGFEILFAQMGCNYLLLSHVMYPQRMSSFQHLVQGVFVIISFAQGVIVYVFWTYWEDWNFGMDQHMWLLKRFEKGE